jgi:hypothetical protein
MPNKFVVVTLSDVSLFHRWLRRRQCHQRGKWVNHYFRCGVAL